jgi:hypothetical protein
MNATVIEDAELSAWSFTKLDSLLRERRDFCRQILVILGEKMAESQAMARALANKKCDIRSHAQTQPNVKRAASSPVSQNCSNLICRHSAQRRLIGAHLCSDTHRRSRGTTNSPGSAPRWTARAPLPQGAEQVDLPNPCSATRAVQRGAPPDATKFLQMNPGA